jgi:hypothetical protein
MRRRQGHIRERNEGAWELRYNLGTDPATGNAGSSQQRSTATARLPSASLGDCLRALDTGEHVDPARMTGSGMAFRMDCCRTRGSQPEVARALFRDCREFSGGRAWRAADQQAHCPSTFKLL